MKIFSDFDVYMHKYTYDEMKVMFVLSGIDESSDSILDYEDLMRIVYALYENWLEGVDAPLDDIKYKKFPWLEILTNEEEGYIQAYAERVLPNLIQLYLEELKNG